MILWINLRLASGFHIPFVKGIASLLMSPLAQERLHTNMALISHVTNGKQLDFINGNCLWQKAIEIDMANVCAAFEILEPNQYKPIGWKDSSVHLVYDVMMYFTRKA